MDRLFGIDVTKRAEDLQPETELEFEAENEKQSDSEVLIEQEGLDVEPEAAAVPKAEPKVAQGRPSRNVDIDIKYGAGKHHDKEIV